MRLLLSAIAVLLAGTSVFGAAAPTGELTVHKWSGSLNVPDPVAVTVDPQGRVYVASTTRRKVADLDIREHRMWTAADVGLASVEEKSAFYRRVLAPGETPRPRGGLADHNGDGSIDWRDLTVHTERIYQLRDTDGDGTADRITVFAEGFNTDVTGIAAGVLWHDGWLYATIAPDLWRLKDTDDDGVADIREVVVTGFGIHIAYAGHDMHGLSVGPDGRIYWSIGDKGFSVTSREGRRFHHPNEGAMFRIEPDGSGFEVYARGLRNAQEPAFDDWGHLINVENDADMPGELERFVHIVEGSDSAWRNNYQYMSLASPWMREGLWKPWFEGQAAYILPPISNYSNGPAGFRRDPGTAMGTGQRGHYFLSEFPAGIISGFRAEPVGASFRMADARDMHAGIPGVGMSWHPDGSLMMVDWDGGYALTQTGAVWKIDAAEGREDALRRETAEHIRNGFGHHEVPALIELLAHRDQRVRQGAQFELARRNDSAPLLSVARDPTASLLARVHGVWGYGQLLRRQAAGIEVLLPLLADPESEIRAQTAKVLGDAAHAGSAARAVLPLLEDPEPRVRLQAALALGKWQTQGAAAPLFAMAAREGNDPVLRHAAIFGLTGCASTAELAARTGDPSVHVRLASVVALRRQGSAELAAFLHDPSVLVIEEAARAIHDDESIPAALPALAALLRPGLASEVVLRRALNANLRLGTPEAGSRVLAFVLDDAVSTALRREALLTLQAWSEPPELDRVDGWARALQPAPIGHLLQPKLDALLALADPELRTLAVRLMVAHKLEARANQIAPILADANAPDDLRAQILRLMAVRRQTDPDFPRALEAALTPESPDLLYRTALEFLLPAQPSRLVSEARSALQNRRAPVQQQALALLGSAGHPEADAFLSEQAAVLLAGNFPPALQLDLLEALEARRAGHAGIAAALLAYAGSPAAAARHELIEGGTVAIGRDLAMNHLGANCVACHRIESREGSEVGPSLRSIGRERDAASLLRSLIDPGAELSPGFGFVAVTLTNGESLAGSLVSETPEALTIRLADGAVQELARTRIASVTPPVSVMPPMSGILDSRQLRDLVAYLRTLNARQ